MFVRSRILGGGRRQRATAHPAALRQRQVPAVATTAQDPLSLAVKRQKSGSRPMGRLGLSPAAMSVPCAPPSASVAVVPNHHRLPLSKRCLHTYSGNIISIINMKYSAASYTQNAAYNTIFARTCTQLTQHGAKLCHSRRTSVRPRGSTAFSSCHPCAAAAAAKSGHCCCSAARLASSWCISAAPACCTGGAAPLPPPAAVPAPAAAGEVPSP